MPPLPAGSLAYATIQSLGAVRNDYAGWVGMQVTIGATPLTVTHLGRMVVAGNTKIHTIKLVRPSSQDVPGGAVSLDTRISAGAVAGQINYAALAVPLVLTANGKYWVVSKEQAGADSWHDYEATRIVPAAVAAADGVVYGTGVAGAWNMNEFANRAYGPVGFAYVPTAPTTEPTNTFHMIW